MEISDQTYVYSTGEKMLSKTLYVPICSFQLMKLPLNTKVQQATSCMLEIWAVNNVTGNAMMLLLATSQLNVIAERNKKDGYRQQNVRQRQKIISRPYYRLWRLYFGEFAAILEIFNVKEWPDLEIWVWGPSRSLKNATWIVHHESWLPI